MSENFPPPQSHNQSIAFAAALQRAKQIAAKINPGGGDSRQKRPLEDGLEPDPKKVAGDSLSPPGSGAAAQAAAQAAAVAARVAANAVHGGLGSGPGLGSGGPTINEDIKVPDKMVGLIIGRGGEQITRLQSESGCKIQMAPDSQGSQERICSLSGSRDAIMRAKELIANIVQQRGRAEGLSGFDLGTGMGGGPGGGGGNGPSNNMSHMGGGPSGGGGGGGGGRNFVEIMVPGPKVGLIIGKGGETIKQLQEKSGAKMVVIQDGPSQEQEKPLRISGDPQKVEYAKQLVYDLIAEKEMQAYNRRGGGSGGGGGREDRQPFNDYGSNQGGGGGPDGVEVLVPRAAVGVVIGKGGDMIKKIQAETGARVQFQQGRDDGPGERRCYLSGKPQHVEQARQRIEELIDSVHRRDNDGGGRGGRGRGGGSDRGGFEHNNRGNGNQDYWEDRRPPQQQQQQQEVTFVVPSSKCGVIIGRGGETIKQINQQSGAHCELDRRSPGQTGQDKTFTIRGDPDQVEAAKRIISEKVQMPLNFVSNTGSNIPTAYPGMAPQGYNPQNWGSAPQYQQQWTPSQPSDNGAPQVQVNPATGQPDYSLQWAEYYRSLGMHREAEMIEQQAKGKGMAPAGIQPQQAQVGAAAPVAQAAAAVPTQAAVANGAAQPDYSAQWADYYRSIGKLKEAEAIEAQMKAKQAGGASAVITPQTVAGAQGGAPTAFQSQAPYGAYQAATGFYGSQPQASAPQAAAAPQGNQYGFQYGYAGPDN